MVLILIQNDLYISIRNGTRNSSALFLLVSQQCCPCVSTTPAEHNTRAMVGCLYLSLCSPAPPTPSLHTWSFRRQSPAAPRPSPTASKGPDRTAPTPAPTKAAPPMMPGEGVPPSPPSPPPPPPPPPPLPLLPRRLSSS